MRVDGNLNACETLSGRSHKQIIIQTHAKRMELAEKAALAALNGKDHPSTPPKI